MTLIIKFLELTETEQTSFIAEGRLCSAFYVGQDPKPQPDQTRPRSNQRACHYYASCHHMWSGRESLCLHTGHCSSRKFASSQGLALACSMSRRHSARVLLILLESSHWASRSVSMLFQNDMFICSTTLLFVLSSMGGRLYTFPLDFCHSSSCFL